MTDDQLAALISFGVPGTIWLFFTLGYRLGTRRTAKVIEKHLEDERASRIERWTPPAPQPSGKPGTSQRLLSDYEDAIYTESRHAVAAQFGSGDEQQHVALAAQLHGDVRRLRGRILEEMEAPRSAHRSPASEGAM